MQAKIHLRQGKNGTAACAVRGITGAGNVIHNGRRTYQCMTSVVVGVNEFKATAAADRCAHCCDRFVPMMTARYARLGLPPFAEKLS